MFIDFTLIGKTPLMMHFDNVLVAEEIEAELARKANRGKAGDDRTPTWRWQSYLYVDAEGKYISIPAENLMSCLRSAGSALKHKRGTLKAISQVDIEMTAESFPLLVDGEPIEYADILALRDLSFAEQANAVKELGFAIDVRRATIQKSKWVRTRPRFDSWEARGSLTVPEGSPLTLEVVQAMFEIAGRQIGLMDWRPSSPRPGRYGTFKAVVTAGGEPKRASSGRRSRSLAAVD